MSDLENFTKYYARVRAKSTHSQSDWTGTLSFTTIVGRVNLLTPTNNAINRSVSDKLIWQDLSGAIEYQLQVATDENFTSIIVDENLNAEEYSYNNLNYLTKYYWRVRGKDPSNNYGEW